MTAALWYVVGYSLTIGAFMLGWWGFALANHVVPEVEAGGREIWFHIAAETTTGVVLIAGAIATLVAPDHRVPAMLSAFGLGLVVYSLIASPGYYVERGERPMLVMFGAIWLFTLPAVALRLL